MSSESRDSIRRAFWEDYVRRVAQALAVTHVDLDLDICVNRAVTLADKVEAAIEKKFPSSNVFRSMVDPLPTEERMRK